MASGKEVLVRATGWASMAFLPPHPRRGVRANRHTIVTLERKVQEKGGKTEHRSGTDTLVGADCEGSRGKDCPAVTVLFAFS